MNPQTIITAVRIIAINCGYEPTSTSGLIEYIKPKEDGIFLVFHHGTPRHLVTTQGTAWVIAGGIQGNTKNLQQRIRNAFECKTIQDAYYLGEMNGEPIYTGPVWRIDGFVVQPTEEDTTPIYDPYNMAEALESTEVPLFSIEET